ncbi:nonstructural protein [Apis mellifera associated microvirus 2]|nr:nonstructural protein [Apis mellifera associated microvirus 2]
MFFRMVAVKDTRVSSFMIPQATTHIAGTLRAWTDSVRDPQTDFAKHPEDYELWHLCDFDDETGLFHPLPNGPERIARALDLVPTAN